MRQGLFAILLILAAFAGGALVNGAGLAWIRQQLSEASASDDSANSITIPEVTGPLSPSNQILDQQSPLLPLPVASSSPFATTSPTSGGLVAQAPPLPASPVLTVRAPRGPSIAALTRPDAPADDSTLLPSDQAAEPPQSLFDAARSRIPARQVTQVSSAPDAPEAQEGSVDGQTATPPKHQSSAPPPNSDWSNSPDSTAPARPVLPSAEKPADSLVRDEGLQRVSGSDALSEGDWALVRRRMEELGIGRFWVEGEFGGPVVFRCLVPVVGDRAVSQHFEAEGDDLLSACQDALRRIALWRATEPAQ